MALPTTAEPSRAATRAAGHAMHRRDLFIAPLTLEGSGESSEAQF